MANALVSIKPLNAITWLEQSTCDFKVDDACAVWRIRISSKTHEIPNLRPLLNPGEQERASCYHREYDKHRFVISRAYLRILLGMYLDREPQDIAFEIGDNKKPFIKDADLHYNVSHSGDYILTAIAGSSVGVDVEKPDANMLFDEIMNVSFSSVETKFVQASPEITRSFYQIWTCKEALLKATAKGIDDDMPFVPGLIGEHSVSPQIIGSAHNWIVNTFTIDPDHIGSVASQNGKCNFWDLS